MKVLHPVGTRVMFSYSWYGRTNRHDGHKCEVVESFVKRVNGRNYYKYVLRDLTDNSTFKAEDRPPDQCVEPLQGGAA